VTEVNSLTPSSLVAQLQRIDAESLLRELNSGSINL
jgi:hypothetical protein